MRVDKQNPDVIILGRRRERLPAKLNHIAGNNASSFVNAKNSVDGNPAVKLRDHVLSLVDLRAVIEIGDKQQDDMKRGKIKIVVIFG